MIIFAVSFGGGDHLKSFSVGNNQLQLFRWLRLSSNALTDILKVKASYDFKFKVKVSFLKFGVPMSLLPIAASIMKFSAEFLSAKEKRTKSF